MNSRYDSEPVGIAWVRVKTCPKTRNHSKGWIARVRSSVGSRRSLRKSTPAIANAWRAKDSADVAWALELLGLDDVAERLPSSLSQAERKSVALARAIVARPALLMLDEPAAGLDRLETEELGERLRRLAASGPGLLLVDHDMALVLTVCDYIHVLDGGRLIASGTPAEIRGNPEVLRSYLGEDPVKVEPPGGAG